MTVRLSFRLFCAPTPAAPGIYLPPCSSDSKLIIAFVFNRVVSAQIAEPCCTLDAAMPLRLRASLDALIRHKLRAAYHAVTQLDVLPAAGTHSHGRRERDPPRHRSEASAPLAPLRDRSGCPLAVPAERRNIFCFCSRSAGFFTHFSKPR